MDLGIQDCRKNEPSSDPAGDKILESNGGTHRSLNGPGSHRVFRWDKDGCEYSRRLWLIQLESERKM